MAEKNYFGTKLTPEHVAKALGKFGKVLEADFADVEREVCELGAEQAWKQLKENTDTQNGITIEVRKTGGGNYYLKSVGSYQLVAKGPKVKNQWHALEGGRKTKPKGFKVYDVPLVKVLEYGTGIRASSGPSYTGGKGNRGFGGWDYYDEKTERWYHTNGRPGIHFMRDATQKMRIYLPSCAKKVFNANKVKREMGL